MLRHHNENHRLSTGPYKLAFPFRNYSLSSCRSSQLGSTGAIRILVSSSLVVINKHMNNDQLPPDQCSAAARPASPKRARPGRALSGPPPYMGQPACVNARLVSDPGRPRPGQRCTAARATASGSQSIYSQWQPNRASTVSVSGSRTGHLQSVAEEQGVHTDQILV